MFGTRGRRKPFKSGSNVQPTNLPTFVPSHLDSSSLIDAPASTPSFPSFSSPPPSSHPSLPAIRDQIAYYFGDQNWARDSFLQEIARDHQGWVPFEQLMRFNRLRALTEDPDLIAKAIRDLPALVLRSDSRAVMRAPSLIDEASSQSKQAFDLDVLFPVPPNPRHNATGSASFGQGAISWNEDRIELNDNEEADDDVVTTLNEFDAEDEEQDLVQMTHPSQRRPGQVLDISSEEESKDWEMQLIAKANKSAAATLRSVHNTMPSSHNSSSSYNSSSSHTSSPPFIIDDHDDETHDGDDINNNYKNDDSTSIDVDSIFELVMNNIREEIEHLSNRQEEFLQLLCNYS